MVALANKYPDMPASGVCSVEGTQSLGISGGRWSWPGRDVDIVLYFRTSPVFLQHR
jgi:hypothetical protein